MPLTKHALLRIKVIDELLSNPYGSYTSESIRRKVNSELSDGKRDMTLPEVTLRQIQMDIKDIQEIFGKTVIRVPAGGHKYFLRYEDPSSPIFSKELTWDEREVLREALKVLGGFDGLDNLQSLDVLKKKLDLEKNPEELPIIMFSKNDSLRMKEGLLGRLLYAISHKQSIKVTYKKSPDAPIQHILVYPYMLKQYLDRWYLLGKAFAGDLEAEVDLYNLALDRIIEFEPLDQEKYPYKDTEIDIKKRFDESVGLTHFENADVEDILIAASKSAVPYIESKKLHCTQDAFDKDFQKKCREKYPKFAEWKFYSLECRINYELISLLASYQDQIVVLESSGVFPSSGLNLVEQMKTIASNMAKLYNE
ncbi:MAG: WYL domain-containing protein [Bacteroidales bacterium]|nr:WYL domain-containing protein [Bacteroidales bacterium]